MSDLELRHVADDLEAVVVATARRLYRGGKIRCVLGDASAERVETALRSSGVEVTTLVATSEPDPVAAVRDIIHTADVLVLVGPDDAEVLHDIARRARAWGVVSAWFVDGASRPPAGAADHLLWSHDPDDLDDRIARFGVRTTSLLAAGGATIAGAQLDEGAACVTCADEGLVAEVIAIDPASGLATACMAGRVTEVETTLVGDVAPHDLLLVHAGSALARLHRTDRRNEELT